jgi:hypothetical protein
MGFEETRKLLGNGIVRTSARPMEIVVDKEGEVWFCDPGTGGKGDPASKGGVPASHNPQND